MRLARARPQILLVSFDAELIYLRMNGLPLPGHGLRLPKLRVQKQWWALAGARSAPGHAAPGAFARPDGPPSGAPRRTGRRGGRQRSHSARCRARHASWSRGGCGACGAHAMLCYARRCYAVLW